MNSFDLCNELKKLNEALNKSNIFYTILSFLYKESLEIDNAITHILSPTTQKGERSINHIASKINSASQHILNAKNFIDTTIQGNEISAFFEKSAVSSTETMLSATSPQYAIYTIPSKINEFLKAYENFLSSRQQQDTFKLIRAAYAVYFTINNLKGFLNSITFNLNLEEKNNNDKKHITIIFNDINQPIDFSNKIKFLIETYEIIASLINTSPSESPIEFLKIESGSPFFTRFTGHPIIITLFTNLLVISTQYIHASYTTNSEIEKIPKAAEAAEAANKILKLTEQLESHGFDVTLEQKNIKETVSNLSLKLNYLISDQSKIKINDNETITLENSHNLLTQDKKQKTISQ